MPLKYYCPKCNKRFVDWGAEKLNFKCPDCKDETLYRVGADLDSDDGSPSLSKNGGKRKVKPKTKDIPSPDLLDDDAPRGLDDDDDLDSGDDDDGDLVEDSLALDD